MSGPTQRAPNSTAPQPPLRETLAAAVRAAGKELLRARHDPAGAILWIAVPIATLIFISLAFPSAGVSPTARVLLTDHDGGLASTLLQSTLRRPVEAGALTVELVPEGLGRARLDKGEASALIIIPEGFTAAVLGDLPTELELVMNPAQRIIPGIIIEGLDTLLDVHFYSQRLFRDPLAWMEDAPTEEGSLLYADADVARAAVAINRVLRGLEQSVGPALAQFETAPSATPEDAPVSISSLFFPAMLFLSLTMLAGGQAEGVWREKNQGTLQRAMMAPGGSVAFLAGKVAMGAIMALASATCVMIVARYGFQIPLHNAPLALLWVALSGTFFVVLLLALHLHASSQRSAGQLAALAIFPLLMLGGSYFPFELMPEWMASLGRLTPNGWALTQFKDIVSDNISWVDLALSVVGIVGVTALLFNLCVRRARTVFAAG